MIEFCLWNTCIGFGKPPPWPPPCRGTHLSWVLRHFPMLAVPKLVKQYKSGKIWTPRYIWPRENVAVSRGRGNKSTTMGGLDILPHGQFPLHVPVLISDFGSRRRNNGVRQILLWLGFGSDVALGRGCRVIIGLRPGRGVDEEQNKHIEGKLEQRWKDKSIFWRVERVTGKMWKQWGVVPVTFDSLSKPCCCFGFFFSAADPKRIPGSVKTPTHESLGGDPQ